MHGAFKNLEIYEERVSLTEFNELNDTVNEDHAVYI